MRPFHFKTAPRDHQFDELEQHRHTKRRMLEWYMRTGKSKVIIDLASYLWSKEEITALLVFAPNGVHTNWPLVELPKHCSVPYVVHAYQADRSSTKKAQASFAQVLEPNFDRHLSVFTVNSEGLHSEKVRKHITQFLKKHGNKILFCVDEVHDFRSPSSKRTNTARSVSKRVERVWAMTGTLIGNGPLGAWSQYEIVEPGCTGFKTHGDYKDHVAIEETRKSKKNGKTFMQVVGYKNLDTLTKIMATRTSQVTREQAGLTALDDIVRGFDMTTKQWNAYTEIESTDPESVWAGIEPAVKMLKWQQIASGYLKMPDGEVRELVSIEGNPRLELMLREVENLEGKFIVWCAFHKDVDNVLAKLSKAGIKALQHDGRMSSAQKLAARKNFADPDGARGLVGNPKSGGVGLDFSFVELIMNYSHTQDQIVRNQSIERGSSVGGSATALVDIEAIGTVDRYILNAHKDKLDIARDISGPGRFEQIMTEIRNGR